MQRRIHRLRDGGHLLGGSQVLNLEKQAYYSSTLAIQLLLSLLKLFLLSHPPSWLPGCLSVSKLGSGTWVTPHSGKHPALLRLGLLRPFLLYLICGLTFSLSVVCPRSCSGPMRLTLCPPSYTPYRSAQSHRSKAPGSCNCLLDISNSCATGDPQINMS